VLAAKVSKAEVVGAAKPDEGIQQILEIIKTINPEDTRVHAQAFLGIGRIYEKAGKHKDALHNYLKVDVLYFSHAEAHAEALYRLSSLWTIDNHPERASDARDRLRKGYPGSIWTAELNKPAAKTGG